MKPYELLKTAIPAVLIMGLVGCVSSGEGWNLKETEASKIANAQADQAMYQPATYRNVHIPGPPLVVLPGEIKSNNATFLQKVSPNNIADYGELELANANFKVLERSALGPLLGELRLAVEMGDPQAMTKFKRGKFQSTRFMVQFDVLKAEPVAKAESGFSGRSLGNIVNALSGSRAGYAAGSALGSVENQEVAGVWIIGLRYKVIDASTTEQIATNYFEDKMEVGAKGSAMLGLSRSQEGGETLDTMVQRLIQKAVADIDMRGKNLQVPGSP